jgi:hypothetical protein
LNITSAGLSLPVFNYEQVFHKLTGSTGFSDLLQTTPLDIRLFVVRRILARASEYESRAVQDIKEAICSQLVYLLREHEKWTKDDLADFLSGVFGLFKSSEGRPDYFEAKIPVELLINKVKKYFSINALFNLLKNSTIYRAGQIIDALDPSDIDALVARNIAEQSSIGTLNLALRDLGMKTVEMDGQDQNLLIQLEGKLGTRHLLKLIVKNGNVIDLIGLLRYSSVSRASQIIDDLDPSIIDALVDRAIEEQRSIGTLNLVLRDLGMKTVEEDGIEQTLLARLEKKITAEHLLKLIVKNGDVVELFNLLKRSSATRASQIIDALDSADIDALVDKTIEEQRSIGTLDLVLRNLEMKTVKKDGIEQNLLMRLENKITAEHQLKLIVNNGTIFELFKLLEKSSATRAGQLIDALDAPVINALVANTITEQRSIGTLGLTLRDLGMKTIVEGGQEQSLVNLLEEKITAEHLLNLIAGNGAIFELFKLLENSSATRASQLIDALDPPIINVLVDKTIAEQRSIGTLHLALRDLGMKKIERYGQEHNLLNRLEEKITARHLLELIAGNGAILELFRLLKYSSASRASQLIDALDPPIIDALVDKTINEQRSIESLHYSFNPKLYAAVSWNKLPGLFTAKVLARLIVGAGTLHSLAQISGCLPEGLRLELRLEMANISSEKWRSFIFRGTPLNLTLFLTNEIGLYPGKIKNMVCDIVEQGGAGYLVGFSWYDLNVASYDNDDPLTDLLRGKLEDILNATPEQALFDLDFGGINQRALGILQACRQSPGFSE